MSAPAVQRVALRVVDGGKQARAGASPGAAIDDGWSLDDAGAEPVRPAVLRAVTPRAPAPVARPPAPAPLDDGWALPDDEGDYEEYVAVAVPAPAPDAEPAPPAVPAPPAFADDELAFFAAGEALAAARLEPDPYFAPPPGSPRRSLWRRLRDRL